MLRTFPRVSPHAMPAPVATSVVGRERERSIIEQLRIQAARGEGGVLLLSGDGGIGKTRLVAELVRAVRDTDWQVMTGRAYALEATMSYAPFADACEPVLSAMDGNVLLRLTRGDRAVLTALAPSMGGAPDPRTSGTNGTSAAELHVRLHAGILQLLSRLAERQPLLVVVENMQWADDASIELFHFLARQLTRQRILLVATWNETERELPASLRTMIRSLRALGVARDVRLEPLSPTALGQWVSQRFDVESSSIEHFVQALHDSTLGNPYFAEQALDELVVSGTVRQAGGTWVGWPAEPFGLPPSVRDLLHARLERLTPDARRVAEVVALSGGAITHTVLQRAVAHDDLLLGAVDELRAHRIISEQMAHGVITYDVSHPMLRQSIVDDIGLARGRVLHAHIAVALHIADDGNTTQGAERLAEQIAAHWRLADPATNTADAVHWLLLAGKYATQRRAYREAVGSLRAALERTDAFPDVVDPSTGPALLDELARLYRRLGEYQEAIVLCTRSRDRATALRDHRGVAVAERRLGLAYEGLGRRKDAIEHFDAGIGSAALVGDTVLLARLRLAKSDSLQALGMPLEARHEIGSALDLAEQRGDVELLARAHRSLVKVYTWSGPAHRAWTHARSAVELAEQSGARNLAWSAHWTAAVLAGFTSNIVALQHHLARATALADELHSPLLQLRTIEIAIEYHASTGAWDRALVEGERAVTLARALDQTTLLARLLYWVGSVYLQRGATAEAQTLFDEAWAVSGADAVDVDLPFEIHGVLPAYTARVMWCAAVGDHARAVALGRTALAMADRTGYVAWAVYRLLPAIAESAMAMNDMNTIDEMHARLLRDSAVLSHTGGRGWVFVVDGERARRTGALDQAADAFQQAIGVLESVPFPFDAARARLRLARVLHEQGDVGEATREARSALQVFEQLGASPFAETSRSLLRSFGARLPVRRALPGVDGLTGRELEIVRLVAQRLSNKDIGIKLEISARTVGTHLANVFDKMGVRDRTALGDLAREQGLHRSP